MAQKEGWSVEEALARCTAEDRTRDRFTRYFFGEAPFQPARYDLTAHTGWVPLDDVVAVVAALVRGDTPVPGVPRPGPRVLTLSRELGAGDTGFAPTLADRLGLKVFDKELLEQEAVRLSVSAEELRKVDEQPAGIFQRFRPGTLS
jgi:hypothetical protein